MSLNLIRIKDFLGKYYPELNYSATQDKYKNTGLDTFFEQNFYIQNNKIQMVVDPTLPGLTAIVAGNEVQISKEFFDHPNIIVTNSLESVNQTSNPRSLYHEGTFSTVAYLICQNHTMFQIVGDLDEPIYIKYKSDCETFYNSVIVFEISNDISVEIVEEIESACALNSVVNYILHPGADLKLSTFYQNNISGISFVFRNIIVQENSTYNHMLFGKGSSNAIDENKIQTHLNSKSRFRGIVNTDGRNFHSILSLHPLVNDYSLDIDYRDIIQGKGKVSFFPVIIGHDPTDNAKIIVSNIVIEAIPPEQRTTEARSYLNDIIQSSTISCAAGIERFNINKTKFLQFL